MTNYHQKASNKTFLKENGKINSKKRLNTPSHYEKLNYTPNILDLPCSMSTEHFLFLQYIHHKASLN